MRRHRRKMRALRGRYGYAARKRRKSPFRRHGGFLFRLTFNKPKPPAPRLWGYKIEGDGTSAHAFISSTQAATAAKNRIDRINKGEST